jgi:hypothetical protein
LRPPQDFFDFRRMSKPAGFGELQSRVMFNLGYFASNYAAVIAMLSIYSLLTNLLLLFVMAFVFAGCYGISQLEGRDLQLGVAQFTTSQLYGGLAIIAVPLGFIASPLSTILWLVGATIMSVGVHAALLEKPIESSFAEAV